MYVIYDWYIEVMQRKNKTLKTSKENILVYSNQLVYSQVASTAKEKKSRSGFSVAKFGENVIAFVSSSVHEYLAVPLPLGSLSIYLVTSKPSTGSS